MIHAAALLLLLLLGAPARADTPLASAPTFDAPLAGQVFTAALAFMEPRTLEAEPIPRLTLWGLHGLSALDPALTPELAAGSLRLTTTGGRVLFAAKAPAADDAAAWGEAVAQMTQAAWADSAAVRQAGTQGVIQSFFDELFSHLDPYSRYEPPAAAETGREDRNGAAGVGLRVVERGHAIRVAAVLADSPADDSGIVRGDTVLSVDGRSVRGHDAATVAAWIAGPPDTEVILRVRDRHGRVQTLTMQRAMVPPETVFATHLPGILVLRVTGFASDTGLRVADELERGLDGPKQHRPRGVVFDLRGNRGGLLNQAVTAVDAVLENGLVVTTRGRNPRADHLWRAVQGDLTDGLPVVVVLDGRTASAAEIMAAALADNRRAVVVGSATLGKGLVQAITPLPNGGELFVTWSRVLAPLGWPLQGLGVMPQLCTSKGSAFLDRQLKALTAGQDLMAPAIEASRAARAPLPAGRIVEIRDACPAAEGTDADMRAARFLLDHPDAWRAALVPTPAAAAAPDPTAPVPTASVQHS